MKVLVCGGRDYEDYETLCQTLDDIHQPKFFNPGNITEILHGGARGADTLAGRYAGTRSIRLNVFKAEWSRFKRSAGPMRNQRMLDEGKPDLVVAFPGGKGTAHMVKLATDAGVEVRMVSEASRKLTDER